MRKRAVKTGAVVAAMAWALACAGSSPDRSYGEQVLAERADKDQFFRADPASPLLPEDKASFQSLPYFPVDEAYRVPASLHVATEGAGQIIQIPTSTGLVRNMVRVGFLQFTLKGQALKLSAFGEAGARQFDRLFVPFADLTTGTETYAGGRYLDLDRTGSGIYDLDFNQAYHPFCVYNPKYDCPYPPPENRLPLPVRAGERLPKS